MRVFRDAYAWAGPSSASPVDDPILHVFIKDPSESKAGTSWTINKRAKIFRNKAWHYRFIRPVLKLRKWITKKLDAGRRC